MCLHRIPSSKKILLIFLNGLVVLVRGRGPVALIDLKLDLIILSPVEILFDHALHKVQLVLGGVLM
jgi:hypothetical protein